MKNLWPDDDGGMADVFDGEAVLNKPVTDKYGLVCYEYDSYAGCVRYKENWLHTLGMDTVDFLPLIDPDEHQRLQVEFDRIVAAVARKHKRKPHEAYAMRLGFCFERPTDERLAEEAEMFSRLGLTVEQAKEIVRRHEEAGDPLKGT